MKGSDRELIEKLMGTLQRMRLDEYVEHVSRRKRLIWDNLLYGVVRGAGFSFGFTVLGAALIVIFKNVLSDKIPLIGGFIAEVIHEIEKRM